MRVNKKKKRGNLKAQLWSNPTINFEKNPDREVGGMNTAAEFGPWPLVFCYRTH